ncbi:MAG TPA: FecR domain-containing protein [Sphingobacterium sp.]|nr:FecR domain-containing protein [Sphingobacterium sp.]
MSNISEIVVLIRKKMNGTISDQELLFLERWVKENPLYSELLKKTEDEELILEDVKNWLELRDEEEGNKWNKRLEAKTLHKIHTNPNWNQTPSTLIFRRLLSYAAVLLIISTFAFLFYRSQLSDEPQLEIHDLTPGTNRALITLADGSVIELREDQEGVVLGVGLTYEDGTLIAELNNESIVSSTIATPRGGQYQITLSDGTKVWLNADTKLTYPSRFTDGSRVVELVGEAYFDVTSVSVEGNNIPFLVKTAEQEVEVLGTQFNIKAYADDGDDTRTTLVEGAVQLHASGKTLHLDPGEQGGSNEQGLNKKKVEIAQYIAWKYNEFVFEETELKDALQMLSRWYDFDVSSESRIPTTHLYGSISRDKNLTEVLKIMESSGLRFRIERYSDRNRLIIL